MLDNNHYPMEYDIIDHCNLNCKNCSHFSQFKSPNEKSIEEFESDLSVLCKKLPITEFKILGGEPLLHSNILGILRTARKILGNSCRILMFTNGIKLNSISNSFFLGLKLYNVEIGIARYPINVKYDEIENKLRLFRVTYHFNEVSTFHEVTDPLGTQNPEVSFGLCRKACESQCYDGKFIYSCAYIQNIPLINEKFGYKIEQEKISISESRENIDKYLNSPCITCKYCNVFKPRLPWERHKYI